MSLPSAIPNLPRLRDHSADRRMLMLALAAMLVGTGGAMGAWLLLKLIALSTNLFWQSSRQMPEPQIRVPIFA